MIPINAIIGRKEGSEDDDAGCVRQLHGITAPVGYRVDLSFYTTTVQTWAALDGILC